MPRFIYGEYELLCTFKFVLREETRCVATRNFIVELKVVLAECIVNFVDIRFVCADVIAAIAEGFDAGRL